MSLPITHRWLRRPLFAACLCAIGLVAAGGAIAPAKAQSYPYYAYNPYHAYNPYYPAYCNPYYYPYGCPAGYAYPYSGYAYPYSGYASVALGLGFGGFRHHNGFRAGGFRGGGGHGGGRGGGGHGHR